MILEELKVGNTFRVVAALGRGSVWKVTNERLGTHDITVLAVHGKSKGIRQRMGIYVSVNCVNEHPHAIVKCMVDNSYE